MKWLEELKVGDEVIALQKLRKVTRVTASQFAIERLDRATRALGDGGNA